MRLTPRQQKIIAGLVWLACLTAGFSAICISAL